MASTHDSYFADLSCRARRQMAGNHVNNAPALLANVALLRERSPKNAVQPDRELVGKIYWWLVSQTADMQPASRAYLEGKNFMNRIVVGGALSALVALGFASGANAQHVE